MDGFIDLTDYTELTERFYIDFNKPLGGGTYGKVFEGYDLQ
jgi:hypothetical protein